MSREEERLKLEKLESQRILADGLGHDFNNIQPTVMGNISFAKMPSVQNKNVDTSPRMVNFDAKWYNMQRLATEDTD